MLKFVVMLPSTCWFFECKLVRISLFSFIRLYTNALTFITGESALVYRGYTSYGDLVAVKTGRGELLLLFWVQLL